MRSTTWKKDLGVIGEFASDLGCPAPLFGLATALHAATLAMGHGEEDSAAVCAALELMAGLERNKS
jgi:3-hydroxyisobutyrate dehydrogenase-like beta-hydroxyacid dehydrogenase